MSDGTVQRTVSRAVDRAYDAWAAEHPNLSAVIDRMTVKRRTVASIRETRSYRQAVAAYHDARNELELLERLTDLAAAAIARLFA